jgi:SpoIVB peptidase S55
MESGTFPTSGPAPAARLRARAYRAAVALVVTALALLSFPVRAEGPEEILPIGQVTAGMKGYGLTVVSGERIEKFGVVVLGVLPNSPNGRAQILVKVSGLGLEESGIVAGMSGSPIYLEGKLAGAVASGWGFSKQPIGGVTPIESMLNIDGAGASGAPPAPRARGGGTGAKSASALMEALTRPEEDRFERLKRSFDALVPPVLTAPGSSLLALAFAGFPAETLSRFQEPMTRLGLPVTGASGSGSPSPGPGAARAAAGAAAPLTGGSSISALLIDGDLQLGATGTVTHVDKDGRFVAFGHPFLGFGELDLPVASAPVITVLPNAYQSFKLGYALAPAYRLTKDRDTGVAGRSDHTAPMVPVRFQFESESGATRTLSWSVAPHPRLLPILLAISCDAALTTSDPTPRDRTIRMRVSFETGAGEIAYEDELTGPRAKDLALMTAATLAGVITDNEFEEPKISAVNLSFRSANGEKRLRLVDAALVSRKVAPGETVAATVRLADRRGQETSRVVHVTVPRQAPEGRAMLMISDGAAASAVRLALQPAAPRSLREMKNVIGRLLPSDRLVAVLMVPTRGAATGSGTLTALPPTAAALLAEGGDPGEVRPAVNARVLAEEIVPTGRPLEGAVRLELEIERPRS